MKNIFLPSSIKILEAYAKSKVLFAFDFDGTLAPIVKLPEDAHLRKKTFELLDDLSQLVPTAVISGRARKGLVSRLPNSVKYTVGNHGLEGIKGSQLPLKDVTFLVDRWKSLIAATSARGFGVTLEDKEFSLALHYRNSRNKANAKKFILDLLPKLKPSPRVIFGKYVVNLVPAGTPHKGIALMELMVQESVRAVIYVGDDDTDEDIFALRGIEALSVRVGKHRLSAAQYFFERQVEIDKLLGLLINAVKNQSRSK